MAVLGGTLHTLIVRRAAPSTMSCICEISSIALFTLRGNESDSLWEREGGVCGGLGGGGGWWLCWG